MTSLHSLPELLVGHLYSFLDADSKRAFYASTKSVCLAPSVLHQSHSTIAITEEHIFMAANDASCNLLLAFPSHKATLRHRWKLRQAFFRVGKGTVDRALLTMLSPRHPEQCARVRACLHGLEELHLGVAFKSELEATEYGGLLCAHAPMLRKLYLFWSHTASILRALPSSERLKELDVGGLDKQDFKEITRFTHLENLRIRCVKDVRVCEALPKLIRLRVLTVSGLQLLPDPGALPQSLPRSLQELRLEKLNMSRLPQLTAILWCVAEGRLPACKKIHATAVVLGMDGDMWVDYEIDEDMRVSVTEFREALDAVMDDTVVEVDSYVCQLPRERVPNGTFWGGGFVGTDASDDMRDLGYDNLVWSPFELFPSIRHVHLRDVNIRAQDLEEMARLCPGLPGIRLAKCEFPRVGMVKWLSDMEQSTSLEVNAGSDALEYDGSTALVAASWVALYGSHRQLSVFVSYICFGFFDGPETDAELKSVVEMLEHTWQALAPRRAHGVLFKVDHEIEHARLF